MEGIKMNKRTILSVAIIVLVFAAIGGATAAWFTDQAVVDPNVFTAGTVILDAEDSWYHETDPISVDNWNPGDCTPKMVTVTYEGTKRAFLRMQITETWAMSDGQGGFLTPVEYFNRELPDENIEWKAYTGTVENYKLIDWSNYDPKAPANAGDWEDWNADGSWKYFASPTDAGKGWWYYDGDDATLTTTVGTGGPTIKAISGVTTPGTETTVMIIGLVCLDGPKTGNEYQGAKYTISATFQAIQASHADEWNWDDVNFVTGLEE
jgi:predicted ribosomally synthesized peptide with SipW-like signal peptide